MKNKTVNAAFTFGHISIKGVGVRLVTSFSRKERFSSYFLGVSDVLCVVIVSAFEFMMCNVVNNSAFSFSPFSRLALVLLEYKPYLVGLNNDIVFVCAMITWTWTRWHAQCALLFFYG